MKIVGKTTLALGKELSVADNVQTTAAGSETYQFLTDAESVLFSVYCSSVSGTVDFAVQTEGHTGQFVDIIVFPTITAPSTELLLRKAASTLSAIRVTVTYTGVSTYSIRARGVTAAASSIQIQGANSFKVSQKTITTAVEALLPASLDDRSGILVLNNNVAGSEVLYIAETSAKLTTGIEIFPVRPGQNITVDLAAGSVLYAAANSGSIDVKIVEIGGL